MTEGSNSTTGQTAMRTMLGRVRGLGSAKEGVAHWWAQRMTAVALVPLVLWFVISILSLAGADHAAVKGWVSHPVNGSLLLLLVVAVFHHAKLGLTVVIEDYLHNEAQKIVVLTLMRGAVYLLGAVAGLSVVKVMLG